MNKNEIVKNVKALNIPTLKVTSTMTVDEIAENVRNAMFERFVSVAVADSELCGVSPVESRKFAIDLIKNDGFVKNCLTATINLVMNRGFFNRMALDGFIDRLLWSSVVEESRKKLAK